MAKKVFPSDKLDQYIVRFPDGMRDELKRLAAENKRSLNAEIIARLEQSLQTPDEQVKADIAQRNDETRERLARLERKLSDEVLESEFFRIFEKVAREAKIKSPKD